MLCSILFSIVNKEKSTFITIKTIFAAAFLFYPQILLKVGTLVNTQHLFIAISLVKLNHSHRKYSRKKFYRRIFLKCNMNRIDILCIICYILVHVPLNLPIDIIDQSSINNDRNRT